MSETKGKAEQDERTPEQIRADIEETREELGDTVAAATEKADVKRQAQAKVEDLKENPKPLAIAGAAFVLFVLWRILRK